MDDDIDIVEHDVLDHPKIRKMFLELSQNSIQVHGSNATENILENIAVQTDHEEPVTSFQNIGVISQVRSKTYPKYLSKNYTKTDEPNGIYNQDLINVENEIFEIPDDYSDPLEPNDSVLEKEAYEGNSKYSDVNTINDIVEIPDDYPDQIPNTQIKDDDVDEESEARNGQDLQIYTENDIQEVDDDPKQIEENIDTYRKSLEFKTCDHYTETDAINYQDFNSECSKQIPEADIKKDPHDEEDEGQTANLLEVTTEMNLDEIPYDHTELSSKEDPIENNLETAGESQESLECTDFVMIKEEMQFDGTDYTDFDAITPETYHDDLPPEDIYHYKNKIILGSKPCQTAQVTIKQEKVDTSEICLASVPIVLLEKCDSYLEQDVSFCKQCNILFATPNALDSHSMSVHSLLVAVSKNIAVKSTAKSAYPRKSTGAISKNKNIARKSTGSNAFAKFCDHCDMVFPDQDALIKHLYEVLTKKQIKCNICAAIFNTQKDLVNHKTVHIKKEKPNERKRAVKLEVPKTKLVFEEDLKNKLTVSPKKDVRLIPVSALFQCMKCNLNLLSVHAGCQHSITCNPNVYKTTARIIVCHICKRKLRDIDKNTHKTQHEICAKFKVYKITRNLYERTMSKCPKCQVHFSELALKPHLKTCGKTPTAFCKTCNILIPKTYYEGHIKKHMTRNLKAKDFIIINYKIQGKYLKRKLDPIVTPSKKIKLESPSKKITKKMKIEDSTSKITSNKIKKEMPQTMNALEKYEAKSDSRREVTLRIKLENRNKVCLYYCPHCNGCCIRPTRHGAHINKKCKKYKDKIVFCDDCGLKFNAKTIISHQKQHKTGHITIHDMSFYHIITLKRIVPVIPKYPQCENCKIIFFNKELLNNHICGENYRTCKVCGEKYDNSAYNIHIEFHKLIKPRPQIEEKIIPQLLKNYQSLVVTLNILYSCNRCDVLTDSYDRAVEHSQAHIADKHMLKTIKCYICNLKFDETCWSKHSNLHSRMKISSDDFQILPYDPDTLMTDEWFKLFESLPEDHIKQITDKSLYGYQRGIEMKLLRDGLSEHTLYSCSACNICYHNEEIAKHITSACKIPVNYCKTCNIPFNNITSLRNHLILHIKGMQSEDFRIVSFIKDSKAAKKRRTKYVIHKCKFCSNCLQHKSNIRRHKCLSRERQQECSVCKQLFHTCSIARHEGEHQLKPDFVLKNITFEHFDPNDIQPARNYNKPVLKTKAIKRAKAFKSKVKKLKTATYKPKAKTPKTATIYKCDCNLHYTSMKAIEKHKESCSQNLEISKENCSKCGLLFPTDVLVNHLCKHHSNDTELVVELYNNDRNKIEIDKLSENASQAKESTAKPIDNNKIHLYKCNACNINFMAQNTCYKHVYKDHRAINPRQCIECKFCGLQFTIKSLSMHTSRHHRDELSLDNVLINEYYPSKGKEPLKIEVYVASKKVQSRQVTSSVDDTILSI